MGGCCAEFCNNSSSKGYVMKSFPRNREQRAIWAQNINRKNWTPTDHSMLCEMHFTCDMWQQRSDGKRKLKKDAIPTIFGFFLKKKNMINNNSNNLSIKKNESQEMKCQIIANTPEPVMLVEIGHANVPHDNCNNESMSNKNQDMKCEIIANTTEPVMLVEIGHANAPHYNFNNEFMSNKNQDVGCEIIANSPEPSMLVEISDVNAPHDNFNNESMTNKNQDVEYEIITSESSCMNNTNLRENNCKDKEIIKKQYLRIIRMRKTIKALRNIIRSLHDEMKGDKYVTALKSIFNEDQIRILMTKKRSRNWSHKTIQNALQIRSACGRNGYDHLLKHGFPIPSLRTLRRKVEEIKFKPEIVMLDINT